MEAGSDWTIRIDILGIELEFKSNGEEDIVVRLLSFGCLTANGVGSWFQFMNNKSTCYLLK